MRYLHFVTGLHDDEFGICERIAIKSACHHNPGWKCFVWVGREQTGEQWSLLRDTTDIQVIRIPNHRFWRGNRIGQYAHRADLVRHPILHDLGGLYMDTDTITLAPFPEEWLAHDTVIGREFCGEKTEGLCNAVMYSKRGSQFQQLWMDAWEKFDGSGWNELSVRLPWQLHNDNPGLCFPVDWVLLGPIHCQLSPFVTMGELSGCSVVHLWRTYWRRVMEYITADYINTVNTTYCLHARRFIQ